MWIYNYGKFFNFMRSVFPLLFYFFLLLQEQSINWRWLFALYVNVFITLSSYRYQTHYVVFFSALYRFYFETFDSGISVWILEFIWKTTRRVRADSILRTIFPCHNIRSKPFAKIAGVDLDNVEPAKTVCGTISK